jgi:hypothetical protein
VDSGCVQHYSDDEDEDDADDDDDDDDDEDDDAKPARALVSCAVLDESVAKIPVMFVGLSCHANRHPRYSNERGHGNIKVILCHGGNGLMSQQRTQFVGHTQPVHALSLLPGRVLVSVDFCLHLGYIIVWNIARNAQLKVAFFNNHALFMSHKIMSPMSPREMTGSQLLDLQSENSVLFLEKWKALQMVMDPDFKSTGRSTLPGQGFRDDRPSSLLNGRFLELWSKYYDSLKLGCKPAVVCKLSKKTEPDTVHLKYEIRGVRKGRYDPEFIDMGMLVVTLKNDLILTEDVDPDISVEQPEIVKPTSAGLERPKKQKKHYQKPNDDNENESLGDASDGNSDFDEDCIIEQEIQSMIEIIDVVDQILSVVENFQGADCLRDSIITGMVLNSTVIGTATSELELPIDNGRLIANLSISLAVAAVIDSIVTDIERNAKATRQPTPSTLETILYELENGDVRTKASRLLREGPIIDLRSLPWELGATASLQSALTPSKYNIPQDTSGERASGVRRDLRAQPKNEASDAFDDNVVQGIFGDNVLEVPMLNLAKSLAIRHQHAW